MLRAEPPRNDLSEGITMRTRSSTIAGLLAAAGAALAIAAAPVASAEPLLPRCEEEGGGAFAGATTECASPGNVQVETSPNIYGQFGMFPWDDEVWTL
jgi:hypothetical protein